MTEKLSPPQPDKIQKTVTKRVRKIATKKQLQKQLHTKKMKKQVLNNSFK